MVASTTIRWKAETHEQVRRKHQRQQEYARGRILRYAQGIGLSGGHSSGPSCGRHSRIHCGFRARDADEAVSPLSNPDSATGTAVLERPQAEEKLKGTDDGDADRFAHYVSKRRMEQSRLTGRPVVALCGKIWVPKHDPSQYPVCPECKRIYEQMMGGAGNGGE